MLWCNWATDNLPRSPMKTASSSVFLTVRSPFLENSRLHSSGATWIYNTFRLFGGWFFAFMFFALFFIALFYMQFSADSKRIKSKRLIQVLLPQRSRRPWLTKIVLILWFFISLFVKNCLWYDTWFFSIAENRF